MTIIKRGSKYAVVIYDPNTQGKKWIGTYAKRPLAVKAEAQAILDRDKQVEESELVDVFQARWTTDHAAPKESTNLHYRERTAKFAKDFKGRNLNSITRKEARRWALDNRGRHPEVRTMFSAAMREGLCDTNPFADMRLPQSRGRRDLVVPTEAELNALIEAARTTWREWGCKVYAPMIQFAAYTGMRAGEIHALRWSDIDETTRIIRVDRQYSHKVGAFTLPKNGKARTAYLSPPAEAALELVPKRDHGDQTVFYTPQEKMFTGRVSAYYWHPVRAAFGRPDLRFHDLRHYYGTYLALQGLDAPDIAELMGHTDGGLEAMRTYIHKTTQGSMARAAKAFGAPLRAVDENGSVAAEGPSDGSTEAIREQTA